MVMLQKRNRNLDPSCLDSSLQDHHPIQPSVLSTLYDNCRYPDLRNLQRENNPPQDAPNTPSIPTNALYTQTTSLSRRGSGSASTGLTAIHANDDGVAQEKKNADAVMRRAALAHEHPAVVVHPVTTQKALYANPVYTKRIVGFDQEESDGILHFLFDHLAKRQDLQCRVRYEPGTVLVWDPRVTTHSQTLDYPAGDRRHAFRLTALANKPIPAAIEDDDGECAEDLARVQLGLC